MWKKSPKYSQNQGTTKCKKVHSQTAWCTREKRKEQKKPALTSLSPLFSPLMRSSSSPQPAETTSVDQCSKCSCVIVYVNVEVDVAVWRCHGTPLIAYRLRFHKTPFAQTENKQSCIACFLYRCECVHGEYGKWWMRCIRNETIVLKLWWIFKLHLRLNCSFTLDFRPWIIMIRKFMRRVREID